MKKPLAAISIMHKAIFKVFKFYGLELKSLVLIPVAVLLKPFVIHSRKKDPIWLIGENFGDCLQDNGYCFFQYCQKAKIHADVFFIAKEKSIKDNIFLSSKNNVLIYGSIRHIVYLFLADAFIYSHSQRDIIYRKLLPIFAKHKKFIFLQHGVTGFKRINDFYNKRYLIEPDIFIVVSAFEKSLFTRQFGAEENKIRITGFARYDNLKNGAECKARKQIAYIPTWRDWVKKAGFLDSRFYKHSYSFMVDNCLTQLLEKKNLIFKFYLHKNMKDYLSFFESKNYRIQLIEFGQESVQKIIIESSLLITDYSSVSWDFFYLDKPVIFFQVDLEDYLKYRGSYMDFKNDIFGDYADSKNNLFDLLEFYTDNNFKIKEKFKKEKSKYFRHIDKLNCKRIYEEIVGL